MGAAAVIRVMAFPPRWFYPAAVITGRRRQLVKVLFVCTGNLCRSPLAEGLLRSLAEKAGLAGSVLVDSAGTHSHHVGMPPDQRAVALARAEGFDISGLRARLVRRTDFARFDIVVAMERGQRDSLLRLCPPAERDRIALMMSFAPDATAADIPDPYHGDTAQFRRSYAMIEQAVRGLFHHVRREWLAVRAEPPAPPAINLRPGVP